MIAVSAIATCALVRAQVAQQPPHQDGVVGFSENVFFVNAQESSVVSRQSSITNRQCQSSVV